MSETVMASSSSEVPESVKELTSSSESSSTLSDKQRAQIERNRQRALLLKQSRLASRPYQHPTDRAKKGMKLPPKQVDTGGGFLLEEEEEDTKKKKVPTVKHPKGAVIVSDKLFCDECNKEFMDSYLLEHFDATICDTCRNSEEKHQLVTRTEAKDSFMLKDVDLDHREPILKFILKKNPHHDSWGDMKLYLLSQVQQRALDVWGDEDAMEAARDERAANRDKLKQRRYDKKIKELRRTVRSSLWQKEKTNHEHSFGPESCVDEDEDLYSKTCSECGHTVTFEKM